MNEKKKTPIENNKGYRSRNKKQQLRPLILPNSFIGQDKIILKRKYNTTNRIKKSSKGSLEDEKQNTETIKECKSENNKKIVTFNSTFNSSVDVLKMIEFKNDLNYNYNCFEKGKEEESEKCTENNCVICSIF